MTPAEWWAMVVTSPRLLLVLIIGVTTVILWLAFVIWGIWKYKGGRL